MRLDKFLTECGIGSRKDVKDFIAKGFVMINGSKAKSPQINIKENIDEVTFTGRILIYKEFRFYAMYKLAGYITATEDPRDKTVMDLLPEWVIQKDLFPVGRLDKDTEGLLVFTNDGKFAHDVLSPKKHVEKKYYVEIRDEIGEEEIKLLEAGVDIGGHITKPAIVEKIEDKKIFLTIDEGKFHQIKKMLIAVGNEVTYLKRVTFGKFKLGEMKPGEVIEIEREDVI